MTSDEVQGDCDQNFQVLARVRFDRKFPALYTLKIRNLLGHYEPGQVIIKLRFLPARCKLCMILACCKFVIKLYQVGYQVGSI